MRRKGAIFLDRDGVINEEIGKHVTSWKDFKFRPRIFDILRMLKERDIKVFVITNQSCIGQCLLSAEELRVIHDRMIGEIEQHGGEIETIYCCPHRREDNCLCRKPGISMIKRAEKEFEISLLKSILVGDSPSDIVAGFDAGCRTVLTITDRLLKYGSVVGPHFVARNMDIVYDILEKETRKWV